MYDSDLVKALDEKGNVSFEFSRGLAEPASWSVEGYYVLNKTTKRMPNSFLVNKSGVMVLPPEFWDIRPSEEGIIAAIHGKRWGLLVLNDK